jgi:predicted  nucleic acid-binding Zn-ribbon protein
MQALLPILKELHQHLTELAEAREQLQRGPQQLRIRQDDLVKRNAELAALHDRCRKMRIDADAKELSLRSAEQRVVDLKTKLNLTRSTKEYTAIADEIRHLQAANSKVEEEILGLITEQEGHVEHLAQLGRDLEEKRGDVAKFQEVVEYQHRKFTDRIGILETAIADLENQLDAGVRSEYARRVRAKGAAALAACEDATCRACYTGQTTQSWSNLLSGKLVVCHSCGAILYLP